MHRRMVRVLAVSGSLAAGVGGTAALANAASSSPTPSAKPSAPPATKAHNGKDCPNMGGDSSDGARFGGPPSGSAPGPNV